MIDGGRLGIDNMNNGIRKTALQPYGHHFPFNTVAVVYVVGDNLNNLSYFLAVDVFESFESSCPGYARGEEIASKVLARWLYHGRHNC